MSVAAIPAAAHWDGFTDGATQNWYIPAGDHRYLVNAAGGRLTHSFSFNSANSVTDPAVWVCAVIDPPGDNNASGECGWDFERYCWHAYTHSTNDLDCHDRDGNSWWAYAEAHWHGDTVTIHGVW